MARRTLLAKWSVFLDFQLCCLLGKLRTLPFVRVGKHGVKLPRVRKHLARFRSEDFRPHRTTGVRGAPRLSLLHQRAVAQRQLDLPRVLPRGYQARRPLGARTRALRAGAGGGVLGVVGGLVALARAALPGLLHLLRHPLELVVDRGFHLGLAHFAQMAPDVLAHLREGANRRAGLLAERDVVREGKDACRSALRIEASGIGKGTT